MCIKRISIKQAVCEFVRPIVLVVLSVLYVLLGSAPFAFAKESEQSTITFYGKAVDEAGNPVSGANVNAHIPSRGVGKGRAHKKTVLATDAQGIFHINQAGRFVAVKSIKKKGYVFIPERDDVLTYTGAEDGDKDAAGSSIENPMMFILHKKGKPAFVVQTFYKLLFKPHGTKSYSLDVSRPAGKDKLGFTIGMDNRKGQLGIKAGFDSKRRLYSLHFVAMNEESGMLLSDRLRYSAPAEGYKREITINVETSQRPARTRKYVFTRTIRDGSIQYSRLDLQFLAGKGGLVVDITSWTNPDSSRNLEYDEKFQRQELARRIRQTREEGRRNEYLGSSDGRVRKWDFAGNRRRSNREKRIEQRVAEGTLGEKKQKSEKKNGHN